MARRVEEPEAQHTFEYHPQEVEELGSLLAPQTDQDVAKQA